MMTDLKKRNLFITGNGLKILGKFVRSYRQSLSTEMRLEDLKDKIEQIGYPKCSISRLSNFEIGYEKQFSPDLVAAIAVALAIPHPFEHRAYSDWELQEIARENLDPKTGLPSFYKDLLLNHRE